MCLTPFLSVWVVKVEPTDSLAHLIHNVDPKKLRNIGLLESKQGVDLWELSQVEATGVSTTFLVAC